MRASRFSDRLSSRVAPVYQHAVVSEVIQDARLSRELGRAVWLKAEHLQPGGSYKIRPAATSLAALSDSQKKRGVIAASGGNFAISLARAAHTEGIPLSLVMPEESYQEKRQFLAGAEVLFGDAPGYDAAEEKAKRLSAQQGRPFLSPTEGEGVYLGNASIALELLEQIPGLGAIVAGVGGGGLCIGLSWAASLVGVSVIGASPVAASAMHHSLREGRARLQFDGGETWAEPLSGGVPEQNFARAKHLFGVSLVTEAQLKDAMRALHRDHHYLVEAAGAVAYALVASGQAPLPPSGDVAIILSGGNLSQERRDWVLSSA